MMANENVKMNLLYQIAYQILLVLLPLITTPYISRVIGSEGMGQYSYTTSIVSIFALVANLGVVNHGNRIIASTGNNREKITKVFWEIYFAHAIFTIVVIANYYFVYGFGNRIDRDLYMCQSIQLWGVLFDITWFFTGIQNFRLTVIRNILIRIASVVCIFLFVKSKTDLNKYILILAVGSLLGHLIVWLQLKKYIDRPKLQIREVWKHYKPMAILFLPVLAVSVYRYVDKVMLRRMSTLEQLGFYECSEKVMTIPIGVITALGSVMLPKISSMIAQGEGEQSKRLLAQTMHMTVILSCGLTFGLIGITPVFVPIFFGEEYLECVNVIAYISVTIFFMAWANNLRTQYLIPRGKDKEYVVGVVMGAVINVLVNLLLIGRLGAVGAAIGTVCAEGMAAIVNTFMVRRELPVLKYIKDSLFFVIPGIIMMFIVRIIGCYMGESVLTLCTQVLFGGGVFLAIAIVYMYLVNDTLLQMIFKKNKGEGESVECKQERY